MRFYKSRGWRPPRGLVLAVIALGIMALPRRVTEPVRMTAITALIPVRTVSTHLLGGFLQIWSSGDAERVSELEIEMAALRAHLSKLKHENEELRRRTEALTNFPREAPYGPEDKVVATVVVGEDISLWRDSMLLAQGRRHGVRKGDVVVWKNHLIGRISDVGAYDCRVERLTSPGFKVGGMTLAPGQSATVPIAQRRMGIVEGTAGARARMKWLRDDEAIDDRSIVVTAGNPASGMPRGLIIGRLRNEGMDRAGYRAVSIEPEIQYESLETVVILLRRRGP